MEINGNQNQLKHEVCMFEANIFNCILGLLATLRPEVVALENTDKYLKVF
jgi:hypothetical protein